MYDNQSAEQKSLGTAYALSVASLFVGGIHRFYLGKIGTGVIWLLTYNCFGIGLLYDWITMKDQVREVNLNNGIGDNYSPNQRINYDQRHTTAETPERLALKLARKNRGYTTPAELSLDGNMSIQEAKVELDKLASRGIADIRLRKTGAIAYVFPDFLDPVLEHEFEILG
jgi:TM2 domain-containing membrane protein YozV